MKYPPGSFTKNFAWHGTGFRKLHGAIKAGFSGSLTPVARAKWRRDSGINDPSLELIPVNFFLWNDRTGRISPDELVYQAVEHEHSLRFDRLALFAFHLSHVAPAGTSVVARPALWAHEFVRERLWQEGGWERSALDDAVLQAFIDDRMDAGGLVRRKSFTNYHHFFELAEYLPSPTPTINSGGETILPQALFLTWDRFTMAAGALARAALLGELEHQEVHKLLGLPRAVINANAPSLAQLYVDVGGIARLGGAGFQLPVAPAPETPEEAGEAWLEQEETDAVVERQQVTRQAQKRDRRKAAGLKRHYDNACMFCGTKVAVGPGRFYCEAAHIRPLGKPHDGPDKISNMLVLCPNHHLQFDRGMIRLRKAGPDYVIVSKVPADPLEGRKVPQKHQLDDLCVQWHFRWFTERR